MYELQIYRELVCHDNEEWHKNSRGTDWLIFHETVELCKFWRKTGQWFEKRNEKFGKFSPDYLKVSKLELWWDPFVQSRKGMNLKFTEELCVMTMNNNAKFEGKSTFHFKTDMRNLTNFDPSTQKSKKLLFNLLFNYPRKLSS